MLAPVIAAMSFAVAMPAMSRPIARIVAVAVAIGDVAATVTIGDLAAAGAFALVGVLRVAGAHDARGQAT